MFEKLAGGNGHQYSGLVKARSQLLSPEGHGQYDENKPCFCPHPQPGMGGRYRQRHSLRALQTQSVNNQKVPLLLTCPESNYKAEMETDGQKTAEEKDFIKAV